MTTSINFMAYPSVCAYSNGITKKREELNDFMKKVNANIAINQAEIKCKILEDIIEAPDVTQAQRNELVKELNAAKVELYTLYRDNNVG